MFNPRFTSGCPYRLFLFALLSVCTSALKFWGTAFKSSLTLRQEKLHQSSKLCYYKSTIMIWPITPELQSLVSQKQSLVRLSIVLDIKSVTFSVLTLELTVSIKWIDMQIKSNYNQYRGVFKVIERREKRKCSQWRDGANNNSLMKMEGWWMW